ncbi:MAG TPA: hypothetical protein VMW41_02690 [Candidatus Bathyarchaeia archaeon]|nr:hypothetical protein [Candidatus Bathyarchaeia archaeon]
MNVKMRLVLALTLGLLMALGVMAVLAASPKMGVFVAVDSSGSRTFTDTQEGLGFASRLALELNADEAEVAGGGYYGDRFYTVTLLTDPQTASDAFLRVAGTVTPTGDTYCLPAIEAGVAMFDGLPWAGTRGFIFVGDGWCTDAAQACVRLNELRAQGYTMAAYIQDQEGGTDLLGCVDEYYYQPPPDEGKVIDDLRNHQPNVDVDLLAQPDPVTSGGSLTYTVQLANVGGITDTFHLTLTLPSQVSPSGSHTWTVTDLPPTMTWQTTVVVTVNPSFIGTITATVRTDGSKGSWDEVVVTTTVETIPLPTCQICYVSTAGSDDSNDCSDATNPCRTVQQAVNRAESDAEIRIAGGVYTDVQSRTESAATDASILAALGDDWRLLVDTKRQHEVETLLAAVQLQATTQTISQVVFVDQHLSLLGGYSADFSVRKPGTYTTTLDAQGRGRVIYVAPEAASPAVQLPRPKSALSLAMASTGESFPTKCSTPTARRSTPSPTRPLCKHPTSPSMVSLS